MTNEDLALESLIERLPNDPELWNLAATASTEEEERELRRWVELTGLLSQECCGEGASSECRERVFEAIREESRRKIAEQRSSTGALVASIAAARSVSRVDSRSMTPVWALAAALSVCVLGLAFLTGRVVEQRHQIDFLQTQAASSPAPVALTSNDEARILRERLNMVTSVARYAYPMHTTPTAAPSSKHAQGVVYVCGAHSQWYLALNGLEPAPDGQSYHLWFMTEKGPRSGGPLTAEPGQPIELEATSLPEGTTGFAVTLEAAPDVAEPLGEMILLADESVSL